MTKKCILEPFGTGASNLNSFVIDPAQTYSIILGRNVETGLDKACDHVQHVSRSHVAIQVRAGKILMDPIARQDHVVFFNGVPCDRGERELHDNDSISLLGTIQCFNYRFKVIQDSPAEASVVKANSTTVVQEKTKSKRGAEEVIELLDDPRPNKKSYQDVISLMSDVVPSPKQAGNSGGDALNKTVIQENKETKDAGMSNIIKGLLRQYECAICYETMACACNLAPCGDSFCFTCIEDWAKQHSTCPLCSGNFELKNCLPSKVVDNAVREILKNDKDELSAWEARVDEGNKNRRDYLAKLSGPVAAHAVKGRQAVAVAPQGGGGRVQRRPDDIVDLTSGEVNVRRNVRHFFDF